MPLSPTLKLGAPPKRGLNPWYKSTAYLLNNVAPTLIHDYANNRYYTSSTGPIGFPFTATRTSNATMFNSAGQLVWAPANLFLNSETVGSTGWSLNAASAVAGKIIPTATLNNHGVNGSAGFHTTGVTYVFSMSAKADGYNYLHFRGMGSFAEGLVFDVLNGTVFATTGGWSGGTITPEGGGYFRCTGLITAASATAPQIFVSPDGTFTTYTGDGTSGIIITRAQFNPVPNADSSYVANPSTTLAYYGPRFDYNPATGSPRGLLIEAAATNYVTFSRDVSNAAWTKTALTSTLKTLTDISGVTSAAWNITEDASGSAILHVGATVTVGSAIVGSFVVKQSGGSPCDWVRIILAEQKFTDGAECWFNIANGTMGTVGARGVGTALFAAMAPLGNGWYRCTVGCTPNGTYTSCRVAINSAANLGGTRVPNATYGIDYAQIEIGTVMTSIIPTFGTTATRAGDSFTRPFSGYNATSGVLYANYEVPAMALMAFPPIWGVSDGTTNNKMHISTVFATNTTAQGIMHVVNAGVTEVNTGLPPSVPIADLRAAFRYKLNDYYGSTNGGVGITDLIAGVPSGVNTLTLGQSFPTPVGLSRWIKSIRYYNDGSASNAQIQTLTT